MSKSVLVGNRIFGGERFSVIAGPCAVESREQILEIGRRVREDGASALRGGAFKMRTDPRSFQGLGLEALALIDEVRKATGLPYIVEVASPEQIGPLIEHADALQVGSRNMHNGYLLKELGKTRKPVLLKRGLAAFLSEWLLAAEYITGGGNEEIILCERGVRTFEHETRNTLDLAGAVWVKQRSRFPVIVDPSHGTGRPELIGPMCMAAAAAGLDGVMIEVHNDPAAALSDGAQALDLDQLAVILRDLRPLLGSLGRSL